MKRKIILSERQIINTIRKVVSEARRNPETNVDESFASFYNRMLKKAPIEDIFVSFRDDIHVTDVNLKNKYNTPTGFYTYPLASFTPLKNQTEGEFRRLFPFAEDRSYINFFILRSHDGILSHYTNKSTLDGYVNKIKKLYSGAVDDICDSFIGGTYKSSYNNPEYVSDVVHNTHLFWLLLYDIANATEGGDLQGRVKLICNAIGINGFIDYRGDGYIHTAESSQAVFFQVKRIGKVFVYEKPKISGIFNRNAIQNKEYEIVRNLSDGIKLIEVLGYYGLINSDGELITKQWFDWVGYFNNGFATVKLNDKENLINQNGKLLSPKQWFDKVGDFLFGFVKVKLDDRWNYINQDGDLLPTDKWFDFAHDFYDGLAKVKLDDKWNYVNENGKFLSPSKWFDSVGVFNKGLAKVELDNKCNFIKQNGELVSPDIWFDWADDFYNKLITVRVGSKWNFINQKKELASPDEWYDHAGELSYGNSEVKLNGKWRYVDQDGKLIPLKQ